MEFTEQSRRTLQTLLQQHEHWLHESTRFITTYNDTATTDIDLDQTTSKHQYKNLIKAERALDEQLRALICDLEQLLAPLLGAQSRAYMHILTLLGITSTTSTTSGNTAGTSNSTTAPTTTTTTTTPTPTTTDNKSIFGILKDRNASLQLFLDPSLQSLPWEGLAICESLQGKVARDFSLHMFAHRMNSSSTGSSGITAAAPTTSTTTTTPTVSASGFKYIVDPLQDDNYTGTRMPGLERASMSETMQQLIQGSSSGGQGDCFFSFLYLCYFLCDCYTIYEHIIIFFYLMYI